MRGQRRHVQVRRKGRTSVTRSFRSKVLAFVWAHEQEFETDQDRPKAHRTLRGITVADIVSRNETRWCRASAELTVTSSYVVSTTSNGQRSDISYLPLGTSRTRGHNFETTDSNWSAVGKLNITFDPR